MGVLIHLISCRGQCLLDLCSSSLAENSHEYGSNLWQEAGGFVVYAIYKDLKYQGGDRGWGEPSPTKKK